jgi:spermidine synthase
VGLEIPLLMRILKESDDIRDLVAKVLSVDYLGALIGSLLFALVLLPTLGMIRTSLVFGLLNAGVAILSTYALADSLSRFARTRLRTLGALITAGLITAFVYSPQIELWGEQDLYGGRVLLARQSPYQRIVLSEGRGTVQLFLNGHLQFSSADEHRYHEALVHPAFSVAGEHRRVLVLGGGDGLAVREILRYPEVEHVVLVDLDPMMTELAREAPILSQLNGHSLQDPRVEIVNDDAMVWIDEYRGAPFDIMIIDFPDPNSYSLGRLYTSRFYSLASRALAPHGAMVVQSTSPLMARYSYWCIVRSMRAAGLHVAPYHALVPSFGEWGYALARTEPFAPPTTLRVRGLRFLNAETLSAMFSFSEDMSEVDAEVNRLNDQLLVRYYDAEWSRYE